MSFLTEILSYPFAVRALIVGLLVSVCAALLGVNLVLKRFSMLGDGLSHVAFGSAAVALAVGIAPLYISIPVVIIAAFLLLHINGNNKINGDAAIALVSSSALAIGIIVASLTTGMNTDISNYMFGSILALSHGDLYIAIAVAVTVLVMYLLFYNKIFACTFDEQFAAATGVKVKIYNSLIAILTAVTVVIGMRLMGALLISSIITFPALTAMRMGKHYRCTVICAGCVSAASFIIGLLLSFCFDIPAGAGVVVINLLAFIVFSVIAAVKKRF